MVPLGTKAFNFSLLDTKTGGRRSLEELKGANATVIMFICNHCPYVKHVDPELIRLANDYQQKGVGFIAISANDAEQYPEDGPEAMTETARKMKYPFPYLYDETQAVARAYDAACTPDMYVFDKQLSLVYRGQLDDSRPGNDAPLTGKDLRNALEAVLKGQTVASLQRPSIGCNIKWKK